MSAEFDRHPFLLSVEDVAKQLGTDIDKGLTSLQVEKLSREYDRNELDVGGAIQWYTIFIRQLFNAMIIVLTLAAAVSFGFRDWVEGSVLTFVIVLNVSIGFVQEYTAEKKMDALRSLSSPSAMVVRDGQAQVIPNPQVVPGDIVILKTGDTVPADLRLFEVMNLSCDEQTMTGESLPVDKIVENNILDPETGHLAESEENVKDGDRINLAFASTIVRKGRGRGIVIATGMATAVGKIAAASTKKKRKPGRSMNAKKYGLQQPFIGAFKRTIDGVGGFLGLTEGTPLQRKLAALAYVLFFVALFLTVVVFSVHNFKVDNEVIIYAISTGIAIIPESLIAVLTITMVQATRVMRHANVVVRDLSALEALGGVTNICSDKTGTLTQGAMIVKKAWLPGSKIFTVRESMDPSNPTEGRVTVLEAPEKEQRPPSSSSDADHAESSSSAPALKFDVPDEKLDQNQKKPDEPEAELTPDLRLFLTSATLCNLSTVRQDPETHKWQTTGEPTEIALHVFARRFGLGKKILEADGWKQLAEFPFDSTIKRMSVIYDPPVADNTTGDNGNSLVFTKGAVERIVDLCTTVGVGDAQQPMTDDLKHSTLEQMKEFASLGQRVLAVAFRPWEGRFEKPEPPKPEATTAAAAAAADGEKNEAEAVEDAQDERLRAEVEQGLTLLGLVGIYDPPRKETTPSIQDCSTAGIVVHMLTGDHPATARAIAKEVGIIPHNLGILPDGIASTIVMQATDFDRMTDDEIDELEELPLVIARCAPDTKTRMIEALRRRRAYMAMTGDGVNDAPSLSTAAVGIAMGSGSDVAKSAAKIVLVDDKFNSIVAAIREGRRMFDNIQKFVLHLLASNVGEVILLIAGLGVKDGDGFSVFPISPIGILWINMLTSSFPAFGLGREKAGPGVMRKPPHTRGVFTRQILVDMIVYGTIMGACTLLTFVVIVYGMNGGELGQDCNRSWSARCEPVFRARAAVFAELTWLILISAWEFKDIRRSMFRLDPDSPHRFPLNVAVDLWENRFLFWSVSLGMASVFITVYTPELNRTVLRHSPIGEEWGLVVAGLVIYVVCVELWKLAKRKFGWFQDAPVRRGAFVQGSEEMGGRFLKSVSFSSFKSWASSGGRGKNRTI